MAAALLLVQLASFSFLSLLSAISCTRTHLWLGTACSARQHLRGKPWQGNRWKSGVVVLSVTQSTCLQIYEARRRNYVGKSWCRIREVMGATVRAAARATDERRGTVSEIKERRTPRTQLQLCSLG